MQKYFRIAAVVAVTITFMSIPVCLAGGKDEEYSFKVHNTTKDKITKLLASEDGEKYGFFEIGEGIQPGKTVKLTWDKKTNDSNCKWYFKAVFADGEESEAKKFDFCEEDLELEF
jgi:hypothetical protein